MSKTRFAYTGWAIENDRGYSICLDRAPLELARTENMTLADNFVQRPRAHACGERRVRASRLLEFFWKEVLHGQVSFQSSACRKRPNARHGVALRVVAFRNEMGSSPIRSFS